MDVAANSHARVTLMKRGGNTEESNMREPSLSAIITKVEKMRADGQITQMTEGALHQHIALEMFPESPNVGIALSKFYGTARGRAMMTNAVR